MEDHHYPIDFAPALQHRDESSDSIAHSSEDRPSEYISITKIIPSESQLVAECLQRMHQDLTVFALSFSSERALSQSRAERVSELEAKVSTLSLENSSLTTALGEKDATIAQVQQGLRDSEEKRRSQADEISGLILAMAERAVLNRRQADAISKLQEKLANQERESLATKEELDRMRQEKEAQDREVQALYERERESQARAMKQRLASSDVRMPRRSDTDPNIQSRPPVRRMDSEARRREVTEQFADGMSNTVGRIASWWMASASNNNNRR
ncbi:hypothetical protein PUNSTDRAFT_126740 [Punctularia strigosozonata HHB-11173 SS5]|uniref:uncharacterized protein n=1 Tax=Punctularia strigosozonata (strain HHB-11173) TaxID=741275 RepID=UPI00044168DF|nr:uncharacterized protein PUNSTDRAFT_126740 [Punctularia strigosozonata HHB-11173 SS5]EIN07851.1 hypothetical protein PUNSTDRAFT_126740 [Punctularia strigosozonata HHB-11173 SS5]